MHVSALLCFAGVTVPDRTVRVPQWLQVLAARDESVALSVVCIGVSATNCASAEVVLAVLISTFTFELTDKPIWWNMAGVQYPSVDADGDHPGLPMKVGLVKCEA